MDACGVWNMLCFPYLDAHCAVFRERLAMGGVLHVMVTRTHGHRIAAAFVVDDMHRATW